MSDGIVQSVIFVRTKKGEDYEIQSFYSRKDVIRTTMDMLRNKEDFHYTLIEKSGEEVEVILVHDTLYSFTVKDFKPDKKLIVKR